MNAPGINHAAGRESARRDARRELLDTKAFESRVAATDKPISLYKEALSNAREKLNQRFLANQPIEDIIHDECWVIDQVLVTAWKQLDWAKADDVALVAVGGYGRGELHPYSDIDIQILLKRANHTKYKANIEKFLTFLWDINLEIGQSVRSIRENRLEAAKDITIATALTESRLLYGNATLHNKLLEAVSQKKIWKPKPFFAAKMREQQERHEKYDDIEYALEPNIKVAPGGLRDIQTIGWIAKRYYDAQNLGDLVDKGFLQQHEYRDLIQGRDFLWSLRYGLHMVTSRREDRLLFDHQRKLADIFGYKDDNKSLAIEKLMQKYYRVVLTLRELNDVLLQLFDEDIIRSGERTRVIQINSRFQIRNNYIEVVHNRVFRNSPSALLEIFVLMTQNRDIEGIRASTIRLIRNNIKLINDEFRDDIRNRTLFMELLRSEHKVVQRLRQMKRYGVLPAYLPEFGKIVGKMQHDLFHIYTVDDHTLQVMENMRRLRHPEAEQKFPIAAQIIKHLPKVELLYIAGLYHDIAKGRGGDHSELGELDARAFCERHYLGKWDTSLVCWLVRHHLYMSSIAQREDIQDADTIREFAQFVGDTVRLDYLYALTVSDINATNPTLWNSWRASLMRQLYSATREALNLGLEEVVDKDEWIQETRQQVEAVMHAEGYNREQLQKIWCNPHEDYFFRETAEDIVWQTEAMIEHQGNEALILIKENSDPQQEGATQVFIKAKKSRFLFANIANAFDRLNLNIQDAKVYDTEGEFSLQSFMVLEESGAMMNDSAGRITQVRDTLKRFLATQELSRENSGLTPRKLRHFSRNTETSLNNDSSTPYSTLEVLCPDRPGLLAKIAGIFIDMDISLHNAKITTLGENVEDVFFITDSDNRPIEDPAFIRQLQDSIRKTLDAEIQH